VLTEWEAKINEAVDTGEMNPEEISDMREQLATERAEVAAMRERLTADA